MSAPEGGSNYFEKRDRDEALDASYLFSIPVRLACGLPGEGQVRGVPALVSQNVVELAEVFWRNLPQFGSTTEEKLRVWESANFGKLLEPALHGILWREVRRRDGSRPRDFRRHDTVFSSVAEQERYERAAYETREIKGTQERIESMCRMAGAPMRGVQDMPRLPYREPGDDDE